MPPTTARSAHCPLDPAARGSPLGLPTAAAGAGCKGGAKGAAAAGAGCKGGIGKRERRDGLSHPGFGPDPLLAGAAAGWLAGGAAACCTVLLGCLIAIRVGDGAAVGLAVWCWVCWLLGSHIPAFQLCLAPSSCGPFQLRRSASLFGTPAPPLTL